MITQVYYNPSEVTFEELCNVFYGRINPTQENGQGGDRGTQYRTGIYPHTKEQTDVVRGPFSSIPFSIPFSLSPCLFVCLCVSVPLSVLCVCCCLFARVGGCASVHKAALLTGVTSRLERFLTNLVCARACVCFCVFVLLYRIM